MKSTKLIIILIAAIMAFSTLENYAQQKPNSTVKKETTLKKMYPHVSIAPIGGAIFPLTRQLRDEFKPGGLVGLDIGYRINKEISLQGNFSYVFMSSKLTGAPVGNYLEFSAGPRYFFMHPKLKSALFFEAGVGAYNFRQNSYVNAQDTNGSAIPQINNTKAGISGGLGVSLSLSEAIDILVKTNYHNVFTPNGSQGFMTVNGGLEFRFR
ncbi:MAG: outer membrane beta-barrel protein [Ignavibacteria bacterium]